MEEQPVTVDVGGRQFRTLPSTLLNIPYFAGAYRTTGTFPAFIDRDSDAFAAILNAARDPGYIVPAKYAPDATYYGMTVVEDAELPYCETLDNYVDKPDGTSSNTDSYAHACFGNYHKLIKFWLEHDEVLDNPYECIHSVAGIAPHGREMLFLASEVLPNAETKKWIRYTMTRFKCNIIIAPRDVTAVHFDRMVTRMEWIDCGTMFRWSPMNHYEQRGYTVGFAIFILGTLKTVRYNSQSAVESIQSGCTSSSYCYIKPASSWGPIPPASPGTICVYIRLD